MKVICASQPIKSAIQFWTALMVKMNNDAQPEQQLVNQMNLHVILHVNVFRANGCAMKIMIAQMEVMSCIKVARLLATRNNFSAEEANVKQVYVYRNIGYAMVNEIVPTILMN